MHRVPRLFKQDNKQKMIPSTWFFSMYMHYGLCSSLVACSCFVNIMCVYTYTHTLEQIKSHKFYRFVHFLFKQIYFYIIFFLIKQQYPFYCKRVFFWFLFQTRDRRMRERIFFLRIKSVFFCIGMMKDRYFYIHDTSYSCVP